MKEKDEKKPLGGTAEAAKPDALKQETPSAADKAAVDPGAGKEEEKKPDAPGGAVGAGVDSGKAAGKSDADADSAAEPGTAAAGTDGDTESDAAAADAGGGDPEKDALQRELLAARSQLAAYGAGVAPEMIADAVTLATAEAQAAGDVSAESIAKAMDGVLKRHPEWKAGGDSAGSAKKSAGARPAGALNRAGGFKLGVDPGGVSSAGGEGSEAKSPKRWNRFK